MHGSETILKVIHTNIMHLLILLYIDYNPRSLVNTIGIKHFVVHVYYASHHAKCIFKDHSSAVNAIQFNDGHYG